MNTGYLRFFCLLFGLFCLLLGFYIEQRRKANIFFNKIKDLISNFKSLDFTIMQVAQQIVQDKNFQIQLPKELTSCDFDIFLIMLDDQFVKVFPLKDSGGTKEISLMQYQTLIKKFKNKQTICTYTFDLNSMSVYHQVGQCILWIKNPQTSIMLNNKGPTY